MPDTSAKPGVAVKYALLQIQLLSPETVVNENGNIRLFLSSSKLLSNLWHNAFPPKIKGTIKVHNENFGHLKEKQKNANSI